MRLSYRHLTPVMVLIVLSCIRPTIKPDPRPPQDDPEAAKRHEYQTFGVHHEALPGDCKDPRQKCAYQRASGEPSDPLWPEYWTSEWTMYRVFQNHDKHPPPYSSPPSTLTPEDYEVSYGATYYDSTYEAQDGKGAIMEFYDKKCLPIFPMSNDFTCAFVSLGNRAYFLRYDDRPKDTPECCMFSENNHPPRRDFITHLPYNAAESQHENGRLQAYSIRVCGDGRVVEGGSGCDKDPKPPILFGYAFYKDAAADTADKSAAPYRHPHSFYFSGETSNPPNAPIISQNYKNFRMEKPAPAQTWEQVAKKCEKVVPWCCLFSEDCPEKERIRGSHSWDKLKRTPSR